jgi:LuxR family maltose regulon positive regulatory protein
MWALVAEACLGISLFWAGQPDEAAIHIERASARVDDGDLPQAAAVAAAYLALIELEAGRDDARTEALVARGVELVEDNHLQNENDTGLVHLARGKLQAKRRELAGAEADLGRAALLLGRGSNVLETALAQLELASVREQAGNRDSARALVEDVGDQLASFRDSGILDRRLEVLREQLGIVDVPTPENGAGLTHRELEVLAYLPGELSKRQISAALFVSFNTVATHMRSIYRKLGVSSRSEAVERARELQIL